MQEKNPVLFEIIEHGERRYRVKPQDVFFDTRHSVLINPVRQLNERCLRERNVNFIHHCFRGIN